MAIWGHDEVYVEKDEEAHEWRVRTVADRQLLCTVPWTDAFKKFPYAPDYAEAVATCQSHVDLALTEAEERWVFEQATMPSEAPTRVLPENVVPFRRKK